MDLYEGTKRLRAKPMSRGEYNQYRGWENPRNEDPADPGYLVEYEDGGKANDSRHLGYISWSPADVFERTHKPVVEPTFQQRVIDEARELDGRLHRLGSFVANNAGPFGSLPEIDRHLLVEQQATMAQLSRILAHRIARFKAGV